MCFIVIILRFGFLFWYKKCDASQNQGPGKPGNQKINSEYDLILPDWKLNLRDWIRLHYLYLRFAPAKVRARGNPGTNDRNGANDGKYGEEFFQNFRGRR
jgi:hypothetical protein